IAPVGCAQNRAAQVRDTTHTLPCEGAKPAVGVLFGHQNAVVPIQNPPTFPAAMERSQNDGADNRIQTGGVAAARVNGNSFDRHEKASWCVVRDVSYAPRSVILAKGINTHFHLVT